MKRAVQLSAVAFLISCGDRTAGKPVEQRVADAVPRLEKSIGLKFKEPPRFEARSKEEVRAFLEERFADGLPDVELRAMERAYKRFGLLPDTLDLKKFMLALLTEQIVGYYDPTTNVLYLVQGAPDDVVGITVAHELVHALQDQYIDLDSLQTVRHRNDRQVAAQSVMEGQAMIEQIAGMIGGSNSVANLPGGWERVRDLIRSSQGSMPIFASAPMLIQETLLFPYLSGAEFIRNFKEKRPGAVPFNDMPVSTEQILHEDRYFLSRDDPTTVTLPPIRGAGISDVHENDLGEFETRLFLFQHLRDRDAAFRGAAGWDGDRFVSWATPRGDALAWLTVWDTSVDGAEFYDLLDTAILKRFDSVKPVEAASGRRVYSTGSRTIAVSVADVGGRPVVMYVDVPAGMSTDVIDLKKVVLDE